MFGKAVKIRHCPATVSALNCVLFFRSRLNGPESKPTGVSLWEGKSGHSIFGTISEDAERASQETGPFVI
jgi:hypothetical protein